MASRPLLQPAPVITNGDMSQDTITSSPTIMSNLSMISYAFSWAGSSPVGTITIEVSNDYALNSAGGVKNAGTWNTLPLSDETAVSGNSGVGFIDILATAGYAVRAKYTRSSGSGTLQATVKGKVS